MLKSVLLCLKLKLTQSFNLLQIDYFIHISPCYPQEKFLLNAELKFRYTRWTKFPYLSTQWRVAESSKNRTNISSAFPPQVFMSTHTHAHTHTHTQSHKTHIHTYAHYLIYFEVSQNQSQVHKSNSLLYLLYEHCKSSNFYSNFCYFKDCSIKYSHPVQYYSGI